MKRQFIVEDQRVQVRVADRYRTPIGTKGTIWQVAKPKGKPWAARILWDCDYEMAYLIEEVADDQIVPVEGEPPLWAQLRIKEWRTDPTVSPELAGAIGDFFGRMFQ